MVVIGVAAGAELHRLNAQGMQIGERLFRRHPLQRDCQNAQFHTLIHPFRACYSYPHYTLCPGNVSNFFHRFF